jgi:hypothetical protein
MSLLLMEEAKGRDESNMGEFKMCLMICSALAGVSCRRHNAALT